MSSRAITIGRKNRTMGRERGGKERGGGRRQRNEEVRSCLRKGKATRLARTGFLWARADPRHHIAPHGEL